jgi:hypothetical protein
MRPRFAVELPEGEQFLDTLREHLKAEDAPCNGQVFRRHAMLQMPKRARHLWSPHLNLEVREYDEKHTLHGRFSPHPDVWTGFMAIYGVLLMIALGGLVLGLAQVTLGSGPWGLTLTPAALAMGAFVYGAAFIGQGMSAGQMYELRSFVDDVVRSTNSQS